MVQKNIRTPAATTMTVFNPVSPFSPYLQYILLYYENYVNFRKTKKTGQEFPPRTIFIAVPLPASKFSFI